MGAFVYILLCADGSYYVGSARGDDLAKRLSEHPSGVFGGYTASRRPVDLVFHEHYERITDAIAAERRIKGWSRVKKEAAIGGEWSHLPWLAMRPGARVKAVRPSRLAALAPQDEEAGANGQDKVIARSNSPHAEVRGASATSLEARTGPRDTT